MLNTSIGLVLQAGGNGTRLNGSKRAPPKPIYPLLEGRHESCLDNILKNVPEWTHVFLHIQPKQERQYKSYIKKHGIPHKIHYIYQDIDYLYGEDGEIRTHNGKHVMAPNGPGNFLPRLEEIAEAQGIGMSFFAVYDGCKTGICYSDVIEAAKRLVKDDKKIFSYTRKLSKEKVEKEKESRRLYGHTRYDLALQGYVYEKYNMLDRVIEHSESQALSGLNIFNYYALLNKASQIKKRKINVLNHKEKGRIVAPGNSYYYDYRITNLIQCFEYYERIFEEQEDSHYYMSIKVPEDLKRYRELKKAEEEGGREE